VLNWLLEEEEPSVRHATLQELIGRDEKDAEVERARNRIGKSGWAAKAFALQKDSTYWDNAQSCYSPKFSACSWRLVVLADLGVSGQDPRIKNCIDHFMTLHNVDTGGFSIRQKHPPQETKDWQFVSHICNTGNMVRTLAKLGYEGDGRVRRAADWLVSKQLPDGGWNCAPSGKHGSFTSTVQPLWGLNEMAAQGHNPVWRDSVKKGCEFLLKHRVYKSDDDDSVVLFDFLKTHYPMHYMYDFLHGLRVLTEAGVKNDPRMDDAVRVLLAKQLEDGKWPLEGVYRGWRYAHPIHGLETVNRPEERELIAEGWGTERAIQLEEAGKPSKWITLQSLLVLKRLGMLGPVPTS
jgi:Prenyltransferase and squalene oxidase repeat